MYSSCREEIVEAFDALEADLDRVASHAHHYLCIFDKGKAIALYHTKRLASPGQRIVLYAKERLGDALISCLHHPTTCQAF